MMLICSGNLMTDFFVAELDFEDGFIIPEGINVDLKILILIGQAVTVLPDLPPGQKTLSFSSRSRNWHF